MLCCGSAATGQRTKTGYDALCTRHKTNSVFSYHIFQHVVVSHQFFQRRLRPGSSQSRRVQKDKQSLCCACHAMLSRSMCTNSMDFPSNVPRRLLQNFCSTNPWFLAAACSVSGKWSGKTIENYQIFTTTHPFLVVSLLFSSLLFSSLLFSSLLSLLSRTVCVSSKRTMCTHGVSNLHTGRDDKKRRETTRREERDGTMRGERECCVPRQTRSFFFLCFESSRKLHDVMALAGWT